MSKLKTGICCVERMLEIAISDGMNTFTMLSCIKFIKTSLVLDAEGTDRVEVQVEAGAPEDTPPAPPPTHVPALDPLLILAPAHQGNQVVFLVLLSSCDVTYAYLFILYRVRSRSRY